LRYSIPLFKLEQVLDPTQKAGLAQLAVLNLLLRNALKQRFTNKILKKDVVLQKI